MRWPQLRHLTICFLWMTEILLHLNAQHDGATSPKGVIFHKYIVENDHVLVIFRFDMNCTLKGITPLFEYQPGPNETVGCMPPENDTIMCQHIVADGNKMGVEVREAKELFRDSCRNISRIARARTTTSTTTSIIMSTITSTKTSTTTNPPWSANATKRGSRTHSTSLDATSTLRNSTAYTSPGVASMSLPFWLEHLWVVLLGVAVVLVFVAVALAIVLWRLVRKQRGRGASRPQRSKQDASRVASSTEHAKSSASVMQESVSESKVLEAEKTRKDEKMDASNISTVVTDVEQRKKASTSNVPTFITEVDPRKKASTSNVSTFVTERKDATWKS